MSVMGYTSLNNKKANFWSAVSQEPRMNTVMAKADTNNKEQIAFSNNHQRSNRNYLSSKRDVTLATTSAQPLDDPSNNSLPNPNVSVLLPSAPANQNHSQSTPAIQRNTYRVSLCSSQWAIRLQQNVISTNGL
jgi:hypothetical protein